MSRLTALIGDIDLLLIRDTMLKNLDPPFAGLLSHLLLTPYPSGQNLGGSLFKLRSPTSGTLLYALGLNHTSERHLSGTVLLSSTGISEGGLARPDLLLVEGGRSKSKGGGKMKDKVKGLLDLISGTLEVEGKDLVFPVDGSGRLLELLLLLDQHWAYQVSQSQQQQQPQRSGPGPGGRMMGGQPGRNRPWDYPLCLVSRTGEEGVRVARSLMEWMGGTVANDEGLGSSADNANSRGKRRRPNAQSTKEDEAAGTAAMGALRFRYVRFFASVQQYEQVVKEMGWEGKPKCVLAVPMSMNYGFSRRLFVATAGKRGCKVVLTGRSERGTLGQDLFERWEARQVGEAKYGMGKVGEPVRLEEEVEGEKNGLQPVRMTITLNDKVPLEGDELEAHLEAEREKKEKELAAVAAKERSRRMLEADDLESDSDEDDEDEDGGDGANGLGVGGADTLGGIEDDSIRPGPIGGTGLSNPFVDPDDVRNTSFDIYVKGQQVRSTGFFKNNTAGTMGGVTTGGLARFRMFPFVERKGRRVDVYGEGIDVGAWVRKGREIEEDQESDEVKEAKRKQKEEEEKAVSLGLPFDPKPD